MPRRMRSRAASPKSSWRPAIVVEGVSGGQGGARSGARAGAGVPPRALVAGAARAARAGAQRRLVDLGLIRTCGVPGDGRKVMLSLAPAGVRICEAILPEAAEREAWFLAVLDDHEHRQLDIILDKLMRRSQEL